MQHEFKFLQRDLSGKDVLDLVPFKWRSDEHVSLGILYIVANRMFWILYQSRDPEGVYSCNWLPQSNVRLIGVPGVDEGYGYSIKGCISDQRSYRPACKQTDAGEEVICRSGRAWVWRTVTWGLLKVRLARRKRKSSFWLSCWSLSRWSSISFIVVCIPGWDGSCNNERGNVWSKEDKCGQCFECLLVYDEDVVSGTPDECDWLSVKWQLI